MPRDGMIEIVEGLVAGTRVATTGAPAGRETVEAVLALPYTLKVIEPQGYIVREGERLGVPTPVNRTLHALVKLREEAPG